MFPLGKLHSKNKMLNTAEIKHLLLQHTNAASRNRELLFHLFDVTACQTFINNMVAKVRKDPHAFTEHAKLVNSSDFREKITNACSNPSSQDVNDVLRIILPVLTFGSRKHVD